MTVSGQVLDNALQPVRNRTVCIGTQPTTTDVTGNFSVSGVTAPYDLLLLTASPVAAVVYKGLTRTNPKVVDLATDDTLPNGAHVRGNLLGGEPLPTATGTFTAVSWGSPGVVARTYVTQNPFDLEVRWGGASSITGTLHALQWTVDGNGLPTAYEGHGTKGGISLSQAATVTGADMTFTAPMTAMVSGTLTIPTGFTVLGTFLNIQFADGALFNAAQDYSTADSFSFLVPDGIGATAAVAAAASNSNSQTQTILWLAPGTTGQSLTLQAPAALTQPVDGATDVTTSTDFIWTPFAGGIHVFFASSGFMDDPAFIIVTGGATTRLPDLAAQGFSLPRTRHYDWILLGYAPFASADALVETYTIPPPGPAFLQSIAAGRFITR